MPYGPVIEYSTRMFYHSLSEKDRRWYAESEAAKLGHGGVESVSTLLGIDPKTIAKARIFCPISPTILASRSVKKGRA